MRGVVFTSRNKDNILFDFEPRKKSFLSDKSVDELMDSFLEFTHQGMRGELSRFYININERDNSKTITALEHYLLDHPDFSLTKLKQKSVSLAMKPENAKTHKWLFDYDDRFHISEFKQDLVSAGFASDEIKIYKTVHNYSVVVDHGFDCRELLKKYPNCELKRDGLLCVAWAKRSDDKYDVTYTKISSQCEY